MQVPRRRFSSRQRTSRYMGVGSSNRKNQWQARILVHGKVTHLGYYETEEDAAKVYDRVSISLHGEAAQTNFPPGEYQGQDSREYSGLDREDLQRALGVKPMDKSSKSAFLPFVHFSLPLLPHTLPALSFLPLVMAPTSLLPSCFNPLQHAAFPTRPGLTPTHPPPSPFRCPHPCLGNAWPYFGAMLASTFVLLVSTICAACSPEPCYEAV